MPIKLPIPPFRHKKRSPEEGNSNEQPSGEENYINAMFWRANKKAQENIKQKRKEEKKR